MTNKQKQWQLFFLGYYGDGLQNIDGIFGPKSEAGTLAFQKDYFKDSIAHDGDFGESSVGKSMEVIDRIQEILQTVAPDLKDDGLAGPKTMEALTLFQEAQGLPQTGRVDGETWDALMQQVPIQETPVEPVPEVDTTPEDSSTIVTFWPGIVYFKRDEMRCKCGGRYCNGFPAEPQQLLMELADRARKHFGAPAHVVSGLRCSRWNQIQGGVANSQHMYGEAMDIRIDGVSADTLLAWMKKQPEVRYCYKINSTNVHFDIPKGKR
jgi:peptidoglycan hydrolase-like protein with peptidoglycan-binding domain